MENVRKGVKEFFLKYSAPTSLSPKAPLLNNFTTIISVHKGSESEKWIRDFVEEKGWTGRVIFVTSEDNQHIEAMAASDLGIVYDGQMASSAAACHLPVMVLIKMKARHQWWSDLYNHWWNEMNIIADNNIHPELIGGEAWFGKICDSLAEWFIKPEIRYDYIRKWEYFLKDAMSYQPLDRNQVTTRDLILNDGQAYDEYKDPMTQVAQKLWNDIQNYELRGDPVRDFTPLETVIPKLH